jgi:hypothetical protein
VAPTAASVATSAISLSRYADGRERGCDLLTLRSRVAIPDFASCVDLHQAWVCRTEGVAILAFLFMDCPPSPEAPHLRYNRVRGLRGETVSRGITAFLSLVPLLYFLRR